MKGRVYQVVNGLVKIRRVPFYRVQCPKRHCTARGLLVVSIPVLQSVLNVISVTHSSVHRPSLASPTKRSVVNFNFKSTKLFCFHFHFLGDFLFSGVMKLPNAK